jgi:hypothetical protein
VSTNIEPSHEVGAVATASKIAYIASPFVKKGRVVFYKDGAVIHSIQTGPACPPVQIPMELDFDAIGHNPAFEQQARLYTRLFLVCCALSKATDKIERNSQ